MSSLPASSSLRPVCVRPDPAPSLPVGRPWSLPLGLLIALSLTGCSSDAIKDWEHEEVDIRHEAGTAA